MCSLLLLVTEMFVDGAVQMRFDKAVTEYEVVEDNGDQCVVYTYVVITCAPLFFYKCAVYSVMHCWQSAHSAVDLEMFVSK